MTAAVGVVDDEEDNLDFGDLPAGLSGGGEQGVAEWSYIHDLVRQLELSVPKTELGVLKLTKVRLRWRLKLLGVRATSKTKEPEVRVSFDATHCLEERLRGKLGC